MNSAVDRKKRIKPLIFSLLLAAIVVIGITFAYLFSKTDKKYNVFTFSDNIEAGLSEPNWEEEKGKNLIPGMTVAKDPQMKNTSRDAVDEYAAMKISFLKGDKTPMTEEETRKLFTLIELSWGSHWQQIKGTATSSEQIYIYQKILPQNVTTLPLFSAVKIKANVAPEGQQWLAGRYPKEHYTDCFVYGVHSDEVCTVTTRHHEHCAVKEKKECDCNPVEVHEKDCESLIGSVSNSCTHTVIEGLGGYIIKIEGAVVQADAFTDWVEAKEPLIQLFR